MGEVKSNSLPLWVSTVLWIVVTLAMLVTNYFVGVSSDENYFGAARWHYSAWVSTAVWFVVTGWVLWKMRRVLQSNP